MVVGVPAVPARFEWVEVPARCAQRARRRGVEAAAGLSRSGAQALTMPWQLLLSQASA